MCPDQSFLTVGQLLIYGVEVGGGPEKVPDGGGPDGLPVGMGGRSLAGNPLGGGPLG